MRPLRLTLLVLAAVSVCMTVVCMGYGAVNLGTMFPGPDDTPDQQAAGKYHSDISGWLFLGAGLSWLVTFGAAMGLGVWRMVNRQRTRMEEKP